MITADQMRHKLRAYCDANGGVEATAKRWRITKQAIYQTLNEQRPVSKHMAKRIGWKLVPAYIQE